MKSLTDEDLEYEILCRQVLKFSDKSDNEKNSLNSLMTFTGSRLNNISINQKNTLLLYEQKCVYHRFFLPPRARRSPAVSDFEPRLTEDFL